MVIPLAYNINGEPFSITAPAENWRVREVDNRSLGVVYRKDGVTPLIVPIQIDGEQFCAEVDHKPARYRLDALDAALQPIEGVQAAYVVVPPRAKPSAHAGADLGAGCGSPTAPAAASLVYSDLSRLLWETIQTNAEVSKTIAKEAAGILGAAAHLLQAADGAGMPARPPVEPRNAALVADLLPPDDADPEGKSWPDVIDRCVSFAELLVPFFGGRPPRNAGARRTGESGPRASEPRARRAPAPEPEPASHADPAGPGPDDEPAPADKAPEITPEMRAAFLAIYPRLTPDEQRFAREVAGELTPAELAHWMGELAAMSTDDAVALIRSKIATAAAEQTGETGEEVAA